MLQAMNTGHDGSLSTAHANRATDLLSRLETMVLMAGLELPLIAIRQQIASAIDLIVQVSKMRDHKRRITEIVAVNDVENGQIRTTTLYQFDPSLGRLVATKALSITKSNDEHE
jgi:pilus assembly protein CpaF